MTNEEVTQKLEAFREDLIALCAKHRVILTNSSTEHPTPEAELIPEGREPLEAVRVTLSGLASDWALKPLPLPGEPSCADGAYIGKKP